MFHGVQPDLGSSSLQPIEAGNKGSGFGISNGEPRKRSSNILNWVLIFLFYSYYILEVPLLGSPFQSL